MRLLEAILDANHRALAGDSRAGLHPDQFEDELPLIALTCIDPRLNPILPEVLGVPEEQFIWLRNAGNIITGPLSSTMRSLALACAIKRGKQIVIIGHTDCQVGKLTSLQLLDSFQSLGIPRHVLPDNLNEFFGMFSSERQNVLRCVDVVRNSPLIGPQIPVHGLLVDIETGRLESLVNGYENTGNLATKWDAAITSASQTVDALKALTDFKIGEWKFPETKIGESVNKAEDWLASKLEQFKIQAPPEPKPEPGPPPIPSAIPLPPPLRVKPKPHFPRGSG